MSHPSARVVDLIVTASEPARMWGLPAPVRMSALAIASAMIADAAPERFPLTPESPKFRLPKA
jgi:hypothetical protein